MAPKAHSGKSAMSLMNPLSSVIKNVRQVSSHIKSRVYPLKKFHLFDNLPIELQHSIVTFAILGDRFGKCYEIVSLSTTRASYTDPSPPVFKTRAKDALVFFHINHSTRQQAARIYNIPYNPHTFTYLPPQVILRAKIDTLFVASSEVALNLLFANTFAISRLPGFLSQVRELAITLRAFGTVFFEENDTLSPSLALKVLMGLFPNLQLLCLISRDRQSDTISHPKKWRRYKRNPAREINIYQQCSHALKWRWEVQMSSMDFWSFYPEWLDAFQKMFKPGFRSPVDVILGTKSLGRIRVCNGRGYCSYKEQADAFKAREQNSVPQPPKPCWMEPSWEAHKIRHSNSARFITGDEKITVYKHKTSKA